MKLAMWWLLVLQCVLFLAAGCGDDSDLDVLGAAPGDHDVTWWENDCLP